MVKIPQWLLAVSGFKTYAAFSITEKEILLQEDKDIENPLFFFIIMMHKLESC